MTSLLAGLLRYTRDMKYIYILENEEKFRDEMIEAIHKIDPRLAVRSFPSLEDFAQWIKLLMQEGPGALAKGGTAPPGSPPPETSSAEDPHQLVLVISKNEFLGAKHMSLLRKTRELFIRKGACPATDPTSLVITSFESPDFDIKLVEDRIINNVIFKPFDKLMLQQHLTFAISGRHPPSQYTVHNMKTSATIEMLKEVEIEALSDVGFISVSNRPLQAGAVAKYYSPAFTSVKHRSMHALCLSCLPHPERPDHFRCAFSFLGADPEQITSIRKEVRKKELVAFSHAWVPPTTLASPVDIALITNEDRLSQALTDLAASEFNNARVHLFPTLQSFLFAVDPELARKEKKDPHFVSPLKLPETLHAIFADEFLFLPGYKERWKSILESVGKSRKAPASNPSGKVEVFAFTTKKFPDQDQRLLGEVVRDIFYLPIDRVYIAKKLPLFLPQLRLKENLKTATVALPHQAKAANPIQISEFSEGGLVIKYYRPISIGAFREFVLWLPHELDLPEFLATCNYHEESTGEKGVYFNHFVFFGLNDHYLKHIRRWILQNHVLTKEGAAS